jgi:hypothetical protein
MYTNIESFYRRAEQLLNDANGKRKLRLCNMIDVEQAIIEALESGEGVRVGGTVANAYDWPAYTTHV